MKTKRFTSLTRKAISILMSLFVLTAIPTFVIFNNVVTDVTAKLGMRLAEKQVKYDTSVSIAKLQREIALVKMMSMSKTILAWIQDENNQEAYKNALNEIETFREIFQDQSYFIALKKSGNYYFNDKDGTYTGKEKRYTLMPTNPEDGWFFETLRSDKPYLLNVDNDEKLNVTKIWINMLIYDEDEVVGILGTGLDLTGFINEVLIHEEDGIDNLFIDDDGYIQAHTNLKMIDYRTIAKAQNETRHSVYTMLDLKEDRTWLQDVIQHKKTHDVHDLKVLTKFVQIDGVRKMIALSHLHSIGWHNVSIIDPNELLGSSYFSKLNLIIFVSFFIFIFTIIYAVNRYVLHPLENLNTAVSQMMHGRYNTEILIETNDEIGELSTNFLEMSKKIGNYTQELELKVEERTAELKKLASSDPLTKLLNRQGIFDHWEAESNRSARQEEGVSILMLDIDHFKNINDIYGHDVGDKVIVFVADTLRHLLRSYDIVGRWGGEEFLIVIASNEKNIISQIAQKIQEQIAQSVVEIGEIKLAFTVSIGYVIGKPNESFENLVKKADIALYKSKENGRNQVQEYS